MSSGGSSFAVWASQSCQSTTDSAPSPSPPADRSSSRRRRVDAGFAGGGQAALERLGADEEDAALGVVEDVRGLLGGQVEVDRHRRGAAQQRTQVGERCLGGVLGVHGHPVGGAEVGGEDLVGAAVEGVVDVGPGEFLAGVAQCDLVGGGGGSGLGELWHRVSL
jgi:hypothetical protein